MNYIARSNSIKLDKIKILMCFFVVCIHSDVYYLNFENYQYFKLYDLFMNIKGIVCSQAVPIFFFLSGFFLFNNLNKENVSQKLKIRLKTLLIPYLLWNILFLLIKVFLDLFFPNVVLGEKIDISLINCFEFIVVGKWPFFKESISHLWFLRNLIIYSFTYPVICCMFDDEKVQKLILVITFILNILFNFEYYSLLLSFQYFAIGAYFSYYSKLKLETYNKTQLIINLFFVSFLLYLTKVDYFIKVRSLLKVAVIPQLIRIYLTIFNDKETFLYKKTNVFFIYCFHLLVVYLIKTLLYNAIPNTLINVFLITIATPIIGFLISLFVGDQLHRYCPSIYRIFTGAR